MPPSPPRKRAVEPIRDAEVQQLPQENKQLPATRKELAVELVLVGTRGAPTQ